jgi:putative transposase
MKSRYRTISLARLCWLLGLTRQAFHQHYRAASESGLEGQIILGQVKALRKVHPVIGGRKLYHLLQPFLREHQIKMGRDALFDLLALNKLLIRKKRRRISTTQSKHWFMKYSNLIKDWRPTGPNQLWVADITYVPVKDNFLYLSLITDAYSHKIMGHCIADSLDAVHTSKALLGALEGCTEPVDKLIHHSDRGIQYCCYEYVDILKKNGIRISMTQSGDPLENSLAERVNGIIKNEYLTHYDIISTEDGMVLTADVINRYNRLRPHQSLSMQTPHTAHMEKLQINRTWSKQKAN